MLPLINAGTFALAACALIIIPGPSVLFVIGRSLSLGRSGGVLSVLGNALGLIPAIIAVSLGVGAIVAESVLIFTIIKLVGAAYLVYLGVQTIRHRHDHTRAAATATARPSAFRLLREGFFVGVSNPKTLVFFLAFLPQFTDPGAPAAPQLVVLGLAFAVLAVASDSLWATAAGRARTWFARKPQRLDTMGAVGGVMMIGLGTGMVLAD